MPTMRAKLRVTGVVVNKNADDTTNNEQLSFCAVGNSDTEGNDENNTYAKYSPSASLSLNVANPALFGKFEQGQEYYVDFTLAA